MKVNINGKEVKLKRQGLESKITEQRSYKKVGNFELLNF